MKLVLAIIVASLFFGRPTESTHKDAISDRVGDIIGIEKGDLLYGTISNAVADKKVVYKDFYLFSIGEIEGVVVSVGFLRMVHVRTQMLATKLIAL